MPNDDNIPTKSLDQHGVQQSQRLGTRLRQLIPLGQTILVLTSPLTRAQETAEVIAKILNVNLRSCEALQSDDYPDGEEKRQAILAQSEGFEVVIAVTHYESPSGIMNAFSKKVSGAVVPRMEVDKGNGLVINLITGYVAHDLFADPNINAG